MSNTKQTFKTLAMSHSYQVAEMSIDMIEDAESMEDAWMNFFAFITTHEVDMTTVRTLRDQLVKAQIETNAHQSIAIANERLQLEAKWRSDALKRANERNAK